MIWWWEHSWFFAFSGSIILLLLLYWFKYKGQVFFTQALFLWDENTPAEKSSSSFFMRRLPLNFFLESTALLMMICGGASLFVVSKEKFPPAVVLLDNSYAMDPGSRRRGKRALQEFFKAFPGRRVIWVLCGSEPEILSRRGKLEDIAGKWDAADPEFNSAGAIAWAKENFPGAEICLVTDRPPQDHVPGKITLLCCGRRGNNAAIVNAGIKEGRRVLLEIGSFADQKMALELKVNGKLFEKFLLDAGERKIFNFTLERPASFLTFRIDSPGDMLAYDNEVTLIPLRPEAVTYSYGKVTAGERQILDQVLENNPDFRFSSQKCELLFTDSTMKRGTFQGQRMVFYRSKKSVFDRQEPFFLPGEFLLTGLSGNALVWAFSPDMVLPGKGVVFSSSQTLLSFEKRAEQRYDICLNLHLERSNLDKLPFWPGFFCNLAEFCRRRRPGVTDPNVKSGETVKFNLSEGAEKLRFSRGSLKGELACSGGKSIFSFKECGIYTLDDGKIKRYLAVNPAVTERSDLRRNSTFSAYSEHRGATGGNPAGWSWIFIAGALLLLAADQALLNKRSAGK